jgi:hypothetical protein
VIGNSGGKKLRLGLRRSAALKRDLRTSAFIRAGTLLRRCGPVPGILAARRPGALMHKSSPRFLSSTDSCCNPCLGHHCYLCLGQCVTHVLAICVTYVLAPNRSLAPPADERSSSLPSSHRRPRLRARGCQRNRLLYPSEIIFKNTSSPFLVVQFVPESIINFEFLGRRFEPLVKLN